MFGIGSAVIADRNGTRYWGIVTRADGKQRTIKYFHSLKRGYVKKRFRTAELSKWDAKPLR